jgi:hypothetical protein
MAGDPPKEARAGCPVIGAGLRWEILARDQFTCRYCGKSPSTHPGTVLEVDHIYPRAKGGTDERANLVAACSDCNRGKRDKLLPMHEDDQPKNLVTPEERNAFLVHMWAGIAGPPPCRTDCRFCAEPGPWSF